MSSLFEDPSMLFEIILGIAIIVGGVLQVCTGKMYNYAHYQKKYTEESLKRFMRPSGFVSIAEGVFFILFGISYAPISASLVFQVISTVGVIGCVVIYLYVSKKILVKR